MEPITFRCSACDQVLKVSAEKAAQPARLGQFRIEVAIPGLDPAHQAGILRAVKACLIHNTLLHPPHITIEVKQETAALRG